MKKQHQHRCHVLSMSKHRCRHVSPRSTSSLAWSDQAMATHQSQAVAAKARTSRLTLHIFVQRLNAGAPQHSFAAHLCTGAITPVAHPDAAHTTCMYRYRWLSISTICRVLLLSAAVIAAMTGLSMLLGSRTSPSAAASAATTLTAAAAATATGALAQLLPAQLLPTQPAVDWQSTATVGWPPYQSGAPVPPPPWWARSPPPPPPPCPPPPPDTPFYSGHHTPPPPPLRKEGPRRALSINAL